MNDTKHFMLVSIICLIAIFGSMYLLWNYLDFVDSLQYKHYVYHYKVMCAWNGGKIVVDPFGDLHCKINVKDTIRFIRP